MRRSAVGVDIGGTFTDFVAVTGDRIVVHKEPSTPDDPSRAFLRGLDALGIAPGARYVHGSTVATNAVLERRGARTALLTSDGFRDILEIARQTRTGLYALSPEKPVPLVPRDLCFELPERLDHTGRVLVPLDADALEGVLDRVVGSGAESLAVVFLFSFARPEHERLAGEAAARRGLTVSLSSEVLPEFREYERASTTAANAYVAPLMGRYLQRLEEQLARRDGGRAHLRIMQSNGGLISAGAAAKEAVRTLLSGPAGGVAGAWRVGREAGFDRVISFDMGGTSTDVSLIEGEPQVSTEGSVSGLPVRVPMLNIHTVGAGGGSLARLGADGGLRVGPESAGADPGPAAYGRGDRPTVTDANLVLGRLYLSSFLGGRLALQPERARAAIDTLARPLGLSTEETAQAIVRIANAGMARALRAVSVERGRDPRGFSLLAFGGGGPLHACDLARTAGIRTVVIPRHPGILSALGMLLSDVRKDYSRTLMLPAGPELAGLEALFAEQEARAARDMAEEGVAAADVIARRLLDVRYRGQSYELTVAGDSLDPGHVHSLLELAHRERFGSAPHGGEAEVVHIRLAATGSLPKPELPRAPERARRAPKPVDSQRVFDGGWRECPVFDRHSLLPGHELPGPALLVQEDTTTWLPGGWDARVDAGYNVVAGCPG